MEKNCAEEKCVEDSCVEDPAIQMFILEMAYNLIQGIVTPDDIYQGVLEENCGDKDVARYMRDRAVEEARAYIAQIGAN